MMIYDATLRLAGCRISEKYDGVCAVWDGRDLRSRTGHPFEAPAWFTAALPACPLRGELWCGRGQFERVLSVINGAADSAWESVTYMVFDAPAGVEIAGANVTRVRRWSVGAGNLRTELDRIVAAGGEGLVIRSRDGTDYKLKPITDDDAVVIGHAAGNGCNATRCGALLVRDRAGRQFRLGSGLRNAQRDNPPKVGAVVRFRHQGRTAKGLPRFAVFLDVRAEQSLAF